MQLPNMVDPDNQWRRKPLDAWNQKAPRQGIALPCTVRQTSTSPGSMGLGGVVESLAKSLQLCSNIHGRGSVGINAAWSMWIMGSDRDWCHGEWLIPLIPVEPNLCNAGAFLQGHEKLGTMPQRWHFTFCALPTSPPTCHSIHPPEGKNWPHTSFILRSTYLNPQA